MLHAIAHFDLVTFKMVNAWCGNFALDRIVAFEEANPFFKGGVMLTVFWWFWFAGEGNRRAATRQRIVAIVVGIVLGLVINRALATGLPFRVRPMYAPGIGYHAPSLQFTMDLENWSSFPSDTATFFFGLAFGIFLLSRRLGVLMMVYAAVWACLPRLYLGIHYPSDLIAGALLGVAAVQACVWSFEARGGSLGRRVMTPLAAAERNRPHVFYAAAFVVSFEMTVIFDDLRNLVREFVRFLKYRGDLGVGEGAALFIAGGIILVAAVIAGAIWWLWRVGRRSRAAGPPPEFPRRRLDRTPAEPEAPAPVQTRPRENLMARVPREPV